MVVEELKCNIIISLVLELPNLYKPFKVDIDVIMYVMGEMLAQGGKLVCYHFDLFYGLPPIKIHNIWRNTHYSILLPFHVASPTKEHIPLESWREPYYSLIFVATLERNEY